MPPSPTSPASTACLSRRPVYPGPRLIHRPLIPTADSCHPSPVPTFDAPPHPPHGRCFWVGNTILWQRNRSNLLTSALSSRSLTPPPHHPAASGVLDITEDPEWDAENGMLAGADDRGEEPGAVRAVAVTRPFGGHGGCSASWDQPAESKAISLPIPPTPQPPHSHPPPSAS